MKKQMLCGLLLAVAGTMFGQTIIRVPQDRSTVQEGIDAAHAGDTVLVDEGTYLENVVITKKIVVASLCAVDGDTSHITATIIDGSNPRHADSAAVVTFGVGTDTTSVLSGFTIRGGKGNLRGGIRIGGGIDVAAGGATIVRNRITVNSAVSPGTAVGGGIAVWNPLLVGVSFVSIESNVISDNMAESATAAGGGLALYHPARVVGNVMVRNQVRGTNSANGGGVVVSRGGTVATLTNNIIAGNASSLDAGGFDVSSGAQATMVNNTIVYNSSKGSEGGRVSQATVRMMNNICWNPGNGADISGVGPSRAENNLIRSSYYGANINTDPGFEDLASYTLAATSPCISAGLDSLLIDGVSLRAPVQDLHGDPRPEAPAERLDLGAIESPAGTSTPFTQVPQHTFHAMISQGMTRYYSLFLPRDYSSTDKLPLVMAFVGCGGTYEFGVEVGLQNIGDSAGFILVSPHPFGNCWTDGGSEQLTGMTDVVFASELLDTLIAQYKVDSLRVYLCGMSSGAFLSFRIASHLSSRIRGIAPVAGTMPTITVQGNPPANAVAVALIVGTNDFVYSGSSQYQESAAETITEWRQFNGCSDDATIEDLPDLDPSDGCTVTKITYSDCSSGRPVVLYRINGGAHNWPGIVHPFANPPQTMDIFASEVIFDFFSSPLTAVDQAGEEVPAGVMLYQNYPNPFNPATVIRYSLPVRSRVVLTVSNALGQEIAVLQNGEEDAGNHEVRFDARGLASGLYIYRLQAGTFTETKRLVLIK